MLSFLSAAVRVQRKEREERPGRSGFVGCSVHGGAGQRERPRRSRSARRRECHGQRRASAERDNAAQRRRAQKSQLLERERESGQRVKAGENAAEVTAEAAALLSLCGTCGAVPGRGRRSQSAAQRKGKALAAARRRGGRAPGSKRAGLSFPGRVGRVLYFGAVSRVKEWYFTAGPPPVPGIMSLRRPGECSLL